MITVGCLYQNTKFNVHLEGVGDCTICIQSPDNKNCRKYREVRFITFEVIQTQGDENPLFHQQLIKIF